MLNLIRKRKRTSDSPPKPITKEISEGIRGIGEINNLDEIERIDNNAEEEETMNDEKEDTMDLEKEKVFENENAIKESTFDITPKEVEVEEENVEEKFIAMAKAFASERDIEESDLEAGVKALKDIRDGWLSGKLSTDMLALVMRGLEYDKAVKEAREAGEIAGRNKQIEEKYMRPIESDGLPHLAGSNVRKNSARISSIFDLARQSYR